MRRSHPGQAGRLGRVLGTRSAPVAAPAATSRCSQAAKQFPAQEQKTSGGYRLTISGQAAKAKKAGFKIKCLVSPGKVVYTLRSRKKGQPLQKLLGPQIVFGLYSPTGSTASVPVTLTYGQPH